MIVIAAIFASTAASRSALSVMVRGRAVALFAVGFAVFLALFAALFSVMEAHPRACRGV